MSQLYSLRWNNHQPNFISVFTSMMNTETLVDVTLAAEGRHLRAHKVVLCSCSSYFHSLLVDNPSSHPIVILKDVAYADLRIIVDFMYCGSVNVTEQQLQQVLETAKLLMIRGLSDHESTTSVARPASNAANTAPGNASTSGAGCTLGNTTLSTSSSTGMSTGTSSILPVGSSSILSAGPSARPIGEGHGDSMDSPINSPMTSPARKRRRRRRSSGTPTNTNMGQEEHRRSTSSDLNAQQPVDNVPVVSVQLQRRVDMPQETDDVDQSNSMNTPQDATTAQGQWSMMEHSYPRYSNACFAGSLQPDPAMYINNVIPHMDADINYAPASESANVDSGSRRRPKPFKRQGRVGEDRDVRKQASEPAPATTAPPKTTPTLQKHESYPQYATKTMPMRRPKFEQDVATLLIRAVAADRQPTYTTTSSTSTSTSTSFESTTASDSSQAHRASHTPAVRSGPPLSCNFCWNTVDECGRILRRKTQYHCPECRTNLCIVPCFHEYHEGPENDATNAR